jgi:RNA polymerase sigma-70 factor (ECF subfamily)
MTGRSDEQLMVSYAAGELRAFETLYERHRTALYRYFLHHSGDAAIANDLYQGCWEKVIKAAHRYRSTAPFRAWIYRIARNHLVDHYRRQRPHVDRDPDLAESGNPGPEEQYESDRRASGLTAAIAALPAEQKEALLLKLSAGLDLQSIADVCGVKRETIKSRRRYATARLKDELET